MICISINHKTAALKIRELVSFSEEEQKKFLEKTRNNPEVFGVVCVSTCNRFEVYFTGSQKALSYMEHEIADFKKISYEELIPYYRVYEEERAVNHLFRVICGMESMLIGEDEILGQMKEGYQRALEMKTTAYELNVLFQRAITCAKRVKTDTNISKTPVSIGTLAANLVFDFPAKDKKVLILGITGKMGGIILKNIRNKPGVEVIGTCRKHTIDYDTIYPNVTVIAYQDRYKKMDEADIVISATKSPHYTITKRELLTHLHTKKKRVFIDLSVPKDIDETVGELPDLCLYTIDYFETLSKKNNQSKLKEVERGQLIIEEEIEAVQKELLFHKLRKNFKDIEKAFTGMDLEHKMYKLRDLADYEQFQCLYQLFRRVLENGSTGDGSSKKNCRKILE